MHALMHGRRGHRRRGDVAPSEKGQLGKAGSLVGKIGGAAGEALDPKILTAA
jgi:hypothetical protein